MELISYFESSKIRIQHKQDKLVMLLHDYLAKFMKNAGVENNNNPTGRDLLKVKFKERSRQLSDKDIFLGKKVEDLLVELGLTKSSEELQPWLLRVRLYYEEAVSKMIKYFSKIINSSSLHALKVLAPTSWTSTELDDLKKSWRILGEKFSNILKVSDLPDLMTEVATLKFTGVGEVTQDTEVDVFLRRLSQVVDDEGKVCYPLLVRLGYAVATIYNSSSSAERDFSLMNAFLADKSKNKTSLKLLLTKMHIKAECLSLSRSCAKCKVLKVQGKEGTHCHCVQWKPTEELLATLRDGGPYKRYKAEMEERSQEQKDKEVISAA